MANKDVEFDLHTWLKPEDANIVALATVSFGNTPGLGRRTICIDLPLDQAAERIREEMEDALSDE
jgi:hypothetical protein